LNVITFASFSMRGAVNMLISTASTHTSSHIHSANLLR